MHAGLELVSQKMNDLCPFSPSFCLLLFLRVISLFNPFSVETWIFHFTQYLLFLYGADLYIHN